MQAKTLGLLFAFLPAALAFDGAPRYDRWEVIGPGGGGGIFLPTISPHDANLLLVSCDMTGAYISHDGGRSWRMFNLGGPMAFFIFDPVDPKIIYAKTAAGPPSMKHDRPPSSSALFRSVDSGITWRRVRTDSDTGGSLSSLAVDPVDSKILYAAFQTDRAYAFQVSTDWGKNWKTVTELPDGAVKIFIDPMSTPSDRTIYVIGNSSVIVRNQGGSWRIGKPVPGLEGPGANGHGLQPPLVSAGFDDRGGKPVIYTVAGVGVFVSEDGGQTWRRASSPPLSAPLAPVAVATSLRHPDVAYVSYNTPRGRPAAESFFGVAKTADRGRTWKLVWKESATSASNVHDSWISKRFGPGWGGNPFDLGVAPKDPDICYGTDEGRTLRTTDGGATWEGVYANRLPDGTYTTTGLDVTTSYGVHFDPFDPKRMFISYTDIALFRSENGGKSWISSTTGVPDRWVNTTYWIAFDPEVRGRVWGAMSAAHDLPRPKMFGHGSSPTSFEGGVCRSDDGARTWKCSSQGMPPTAVTHILLDPESPSSARELYATGFARGVFKSTDGGDHWELKNGGIREEEPLAWRLVRDANGILYLVVARRSDDGSIGDGDGALYRSADGADHWTRVGLPEGVNGPHGLAIDSKDPQRLYLAAWGRRPQELTIGGGIFLSTNGGTAWRQVLDKDQHVYDITIDPHDPRILYASGFEASAWRSTDRGESWQRIRGFNFKWGHRVIPDPVDPSKVYITTYGGSVWHGPAEGDSNAQEDIVSSAESSSSGPVYTLENGMSRGFLPRARGTRSQGRGFWNYERHAPGGADGAPVPGRHVQRLQQGASVSDRHVWSAGNSNGLAVKLLIPAKGGRAATQANGGRFESWPLGAHSGSPFFSSAPLPGRSQELSLRYCCARLELTRAVVISNSRENPTCGVPTR